MSTRRRIGVSAATTEAARRHLMQPVPVWEKQWVAPINAPAGSSLKVLRWVKTDEIQVCVCWQPRLPCVIQRQKKYQTKAQQTTVYSDEVEIVEGDEEDETQQPSAAAGTPIPPGLEQSTSVDGPNADLDTKPTASPQAPVLSLESAVESIAADEENTILEAPELQTADSNTLFDPSAGVPQPEADLQIGDIDMSILGPDGMPFEAAQDLEQLEVQEDALVGGAAMDQSGDPFAAVS